ncbi:MAG: HAD family hydrolase [Lysobacteraceae bacterium]
MRIAFDLDGTLIPMFPGQFPARPAPAPWAWPFREPLRSNAPALLRALRADGHDLWIYTSSLRSPARIRGLFLAHGVRLDGVLTARDGGSPKASKYPPAFGIDLLVDDVEGVALEGERHGFNVLLVSPGDEDWHLRVLYAVRIREGSGVVR